MKAEAFIHELLIYRNLNEQAYGEFRAILADKNPEGDVPTFDHVEEIRFHSYGTEIFIYDLDRPIHVNLPGGIRRKVHYHGKKTQSSAPSTRIDEQ